MDEKWSLAGVDGRSGMLGVEALRWSLVVIFVFFGIAKFTAYEAEGVAHLAEHYWLFAWLYPLGGPRFASGVIGVIELSTAMLFVLGARFTWALLIAAAMGVCTFLVTLSFMIVAPDAWQQGYGFPFMGSSGQFLMKDVVLLAACFNLLQVARSRLAESGDARGRVGDPMNGAA